MDYYKNKLKDNESFAFACAGVCLAAIFLIFSRKPDDSIHIYSLYCFSAALPICILNALLLQWFSGSNGNYKLLHRIVSKNRLLAAIALLGHILIFSGVGLIIFSISKVALILYLLLTIIFIVVIARLSIKIKGHVKT